MPSLSRQNSSFGPSSRSSLNSVSSAIFDRFRGFGNQSRQKKAQEERWRRPLTVRNVDTFVEDQRIEECTGTKNYSMDIKIGFWLRTIPEACQEAIKETEVAIEKTPKEPRMSSTFDLPDGGSYSESLLAER